MENREVSEVVSVRIGDITEEDPTLNSDETEVTTCDDVGEEGVVDEDTSPAQSINTTVTVSEHVFSATPSAILTTDGINVQVQEALKSQTSRIIAVVQQDMVDELKSPETPSPSELEKKHYTWEETANLEVLPVRCRNVPAFLYKSKLGSGGKGRCIKYQENWYTPSEFEALCGRGNSKDWKRSIRYGGRTLNTLFEECILTPHAASCSCSSCCDDETVSGPVRLFVPYKRKKRSSSDCSSCKPPMKKSPSLKDDTPRTLSLDDQTTQLTIGDGSPFLPAMNPNTPKAIDLDQQHWWPLEEMVNSLIQQATQLKAMIEQAKAQAAANREAALTQAKLHFEMEKKEAINEVRMEAQMQLSRAVIEAKAEKDSAVAQALAQANQAKYDAVSQAKAAHLIKTCANCGREATVECTDCRQVSYCSPFCQRKDWPMHQNNCVDEHVAPVTVICSAVEKV